MVSVYEGIMRPINKTTGRKDGDTDRESETYSETKIQSDETLGPQIINRFMTCRFLSWIGPVEFQ